MCQYRMFVRPWAVVSDRLILRTFETVERAELYRMDVLRDALVEVSGTGVQVVELTEYDCIDVLPANGDT